MIVDVQKVYRAVTHYQNVTRLANTLRERKNALEFLIKLCKRKEVTGRLLLVLFFIRYLFFVKSSSPPIL